jgi:hypothetical protein
MQKHDGKFPWEYLGVPLEETLEEIDMSLEEKRRFSQAQGHQIKHSPKPSFVNLCSIIAPWSPNYK